MKRILKLTLLLALAIAQVPISDDQLIGASPRTSDTSPQSGNAQNHGITHFTDSHDLRAALQGISSSDNAEAWKSKQALLEFARKSSASRQQIVRALIDEMDKPDLDLEAQPQNYRLWLSGTRLLGEMKATEALDLLISHLNLSNGFHSASMVHQPALGGVIAMGVLAVPKLGTALRENPNRDIRQAAVLCLTEIGGKAAMHELRQAQETETDSCVARFIHISLRTFSYKSKSGLPLFNTKTPFADINARRDWLRAFECVE
jgi:hypothetical protein